MISSPTPPSPAAREQARQRLSRVTWWSAGGAAVAAGVLSVVAALSNPGTAAAAPAASNGAGAGAAPAADPNQGSDDQGDGFQAPAYLQQPADSISSAPPASGITVSGGSHSH